MKPLAAEPQDEPEGSDLRSLLGALRLRWRLVTLCLVLTAGAAVAFSVIQEKQYSAEASLLFRDPGFDQRLFGASSSQTGLDPTREAETNVRLVALDVVADDTASDYPGRLTGDDVAEKVDVQQQGQSDVVSVVATDPDPEFAAQLANRFARNFIAFRRHADQAKVKVAQRTVERELTRLADSGQHGPEVSSLQHQLSDLKTLEALQTGNAELVQPATPPTTPSSPKPARNALLGAILGLIFGIGLALLLERLDRRLKDTESLGRSFGLPVIGVVPESEELANTVTEHGMQPPLSFSEAEAFRMLRSRLRYFNVDRNIRSLLVTSAAPAEGKSTVALNLARTAAAAGTKTLVLEADLHHHTFASALGVAPLPGLSEVLTGQTSVTDAIKRVPVITSTNGDQPDSHHLDILVAGASPPNPAEMIESAEMRRILEELAARYELLVIDTPPLSMLADAIPLIELTSGVLVVGQVGRTTREDAQHLRDQLQRLGAPTLGVVANRSKRGQGDYSYGAYGAADSRA